MIAVVMPPAAHLLIHRFHLGIVRFDKLALIFGYSFIVFYLCSHFFSYFIAIIARFIASYAPRGRGTSSPPARVTLFFVVRRT